MKQFWQGGWLIALVCILIGFMIAVQFRTAQDGKGSLSQQRIEEISDRLLQTEHERDELGDELRAAGAEAISVNGQRLTGVSEIRCAGPTLSVNNVRSSAPFEIRAIGEKKSLENSLRMRGGVVETLGVWGIQLDITASDDVYIPPYRGSIRQTYAHETQEREEESK